MIVTFQTFIYYKLAHLKAIVALVYTITEIFIIFIALYSFTLAPKRKIVP